MTLKITTHSLFLKLPILIFFILALYPYKAQAQRAEDLVDARNSTEGREFQSQLNQKPMEVQFGISVVENGDVYFSCNNKAWLLGLLASDSYALAADIVAKDLYPCGGSPVDSIKMEKGYVLRPKFRSDIMADLKEITPGAFAVKLGSTGQNYFNKEVEGNLLFLVDNRVLIYIKFINLDRSPFHILPMGLYTDTLIRTENSGQGNTDKTLSYTRFIEITVPFPKGKANFNAHDFAPLAKELNLKEYQIEKLEIRAYSSVEGRADFNDTLMRKRGETMLSEIKKTQPELPQVKVLAAENWLEFFEKIKNTEFAFLENKTKTEIKKILLDPSIGQKLEPILAKERKAVVIVFLNPKTQFNNLAETQILTQFKEALTTHNINKAFHIEQEIVDRIQDNKLPGTYLNKLEIPQTIDFIPLLNEKLVFSLLFNNNSEKEALTHCYELKKLDPKNPKVNYNIQALRLSLWEMEKDATGTETLIADIKNLGQFGIPPSLIKRMIVNAYILKTSDEMIRGDYTAKNQSLKYIGESYTQMKLNDEEIYSLAKYFSFYGRTDWASSLVSGRIDQLDINEDLLFYFLNLEFYDPKNYSSDLFKKGVLNAINLNKARFCRFFSPADQNGASIQLLEFNQLRKIYCQNCLKE